MICPAGTHGQVDLYQMNPWEKTTYPKLIFAGILGSNQGVGRTPWLENRSILLNVIFVRFDVFFFG